MDATRGNENVRQRRWRRQNLAGRDIDDGAGGASAAADGERLVVGPEHETARLPAGIVLGKQRLNLGRVQRSGNDRADDDPRLEREDQRRAEHEHQRQREDERYPPVKLEEPCFQEPPPFNFYCKHALCLRPLPLDL